MVDSRAVTRGAGTAVPSIGLGLDADEVHERVKLLPALRRRHEVARVRGALSRFAHLSLSRIFLERRFPKKKRGIFFVFWQ
jgi:hypothetical protein